MTMTVEQLRGLGYRVVDGRAVRDQLTDTPDPDVTWQEAQRQCYRVFESAGCTVYWLSQARRTGQTPGLPDLIVFGPPGQKWCLMWETKNGRGKQSEAQRKFQLNCDRVELPYYAGSARMARRALHEMATVRAA
jgi:hypothetical protein